MNIAKTLEHYSCQLLPIIDSTDGNVEVLNETADFYRFSMGLPVPSSFTRV